MTQNSLVGLDTKKIVAFCHQIYEHVGIGHLEIGVLA